MNHLMTVKQFEPNQQRIDNMLEEILDERIPGGIDLGPERCAICGESMKDSDSLELVIPVHLPD